MNWIGFINLLRTIYGRKALPDLDYIQNQGLLAIKIGQTYALRADFLPEESCRHLGQLYRHTDRINPVDTQKLLAAYTDEAWRGNFETIEEQPLASASVGQVHRARLTSGQEAVVKFIKGEFRETFLRDVRSLRSFIRLVLFFYPKLQKVADPLGILATIEKGTLDELDLRKEVNGQKTLKSIYDRYRSRFDLGAMDFPVLYENLSNEKVMVSEFIDGPTFDEMLDNRTMTYDSLLRLFHIHGFFVFCIGTFHGDIHPGNIILRNNKIVFLDTGAISTVGPKMRTGLFNFFEALSGFDYDRCAHFLNKMADREIDGKPYELYKKKFLDLYADFTDTTVSQVSLTKKMMQTIKLGVNSGMVFEKGMYPIIKSLMYLDGMVLRCNPDAVLMKDMKRFIGEFKKYVGTETP
ncbi:MAG: AarF/ABC1/UbiB kinase family protein [Chitinispirillaceae bacterium]|nr:AarF/ABC1/UbiB kinase family protein [Chitinispirillaceae bacterium]